MKGGGLIAATSVLAVLAGLVFWTNKHPKTADSKTPESPKILALGEDRVEGIRISRPGSDPVVLKKAGKDWIITEPAEYPADQDAVRPLVAGLATLTADRLIDDHPANLTEFGLVSPPEQIDVTTRDGKVNKILFGSDSPTGSSTYVKLADKPALYTVSSATKSGFDKTVNDLRDKRLLTFDQDKVAGFSVTEKGSTFEFGKNSNSDWQITMPKPMRADPQKVEDLIRKLKEAKMDLTDETVKPGAKVATVNIGGQTLELTQAADKTWYANGHKLSGDVGDALKDKTFEDFRNRKLFDFGFNDPSKLQIDGVSYDKSPQKQAIVDKLRDLSATSFADSLKGTLAMNIVATSSKQEKVVINQAGDRYYAQRENDPSVYVMDAKAIDELRAAMRPSQKPAQK